MSKGLSAQGGPDLVWKVLGIIVLVVVLGAGGWFLVTKQSQNDAKSIQDNKKNENGSQENKKNERKNDKGIVKQANNLGEFYNIDQYKTIEEFINSLPEISLEKLGIEQPDMSNWQTYRNEALGFKIKYPEGWTVTEDGNMYPHENEIVDVIFSNNNFNPKEIRMFHIQVIHNIVNINVFKNIITNALGAYTNHTPKEVKIHKTTINNADALVILAIDTENNEEYLKDLLIFSADRKMFFIFNLRSSKNYFTSFELLE